MTTKTDGEIIKRFVCDDCARRVEGDGNKCS